MKKDLADETNDDNFLKQLGFGDNFDPNEKPRNAREKQQKVPPSYDTMLETRPAAEWLSAKSAKPPGKLFGELWSEGEIAILFSATGTGKSILAVQIAESIANAGAIEPLDITAKAQKVLYFDFELTPAQFAARYSAVSNNKKIRHRFPANLIRSEIRDFDSIPERFKGNATAFLQHSVIDAINETGAKIIIIDNINYLTGSAPSVMKNLKILAKTRGLSILVLAHSSEGRAGKPLTINDLQSSKGIANYADSVFTIGRSIHGPTYRYLKHLKSRGPEPAHGAANVIVYRIAKGLATSALQSRPAFLGFDHLGFSAESDHFPDYFKKLQTAEARARKLQLQSARKSNSLTEHIFTGQYARYLNP